MRNFDTQSLANLDDEARRAGITHSDRFFEPTFLQVHSAFDQYMLNEHRTDSESRLMEDDVNNALNAYAEVSPDLKTLIEPQLIQPGIFKTSYVTQKEILKRLEKDIVADREKFPDAGLVTFSELLTKTQEKTKKDREHAMNLFANARGFASFGVVSGSATGVVTDPAILATLPLGAGTVTGAGIAGNAMKAFSIEAAIAGASEALIQPQVYNWKKQINSPYSAKEAAFNIMTAMVAAGTLRATGSALVDVVEIRSAAKAKRAEGGVKAEQEADILEQHADDLEVAGDDEAGHFNALDRAMEDFDKGKTATSGRVVEHVEAVDPLSVAVEAETFQFKAGTDLEGVSERLKGVERWDPKFAGIALVYENKANKRFIVDGHQRVSLAKRMIEKGQDPAEVQLNAIILREVDGVTVEKARRYAAVKNIAEGTGSAVDAAKIFRTLGEKGLDILPSLPPKSALVKAGRGLAQLDDDAFSMVINGVVDEKVGALVGDLVTDAAEQRAIITALSQAEPANLTQARIMINDMRAAGFQRVQTQDLFGGQEITESLFKERARILDNSLKKLRQDKATFKTLEEKAGQIAGAGNILMREANLARISEDEKAIAQLTALANTKGEISDALTEASRGLKEGESLAEQTENFLGAIRSRDAGGRDAGARAGRPGPGFEGVERRVDIEKRKRVDEMTREEMKKALLTSEKSILRSERAYEEDPRLPFQSFFDIDDFKNMNSHLTYEGADLVIDEVGRIMKEEAGELNIPYHLHGDEFITQSASKAELIKFSNRVQKRLSKTVVEFTLPDGSIVRTDKGIGVSYGVGKTKELAETKLTKDKQARKDLGIREGARREPDEPIQPVAGRGEDLEGREPGVTDLLGEDPRAAQAIHDARLAVNSRLSPDDVAPVGSGEGDLFSGRANQLEIEDAIDKQIYEQDLDIPVGLKTEDGKIVADTRSAREIYDDIDNQAKTIADLEGCLLG